MTTAAPIEHIAFISDVHGDIHALDDALSSSERIGCDLVVCAGDLVDFGLFADEVIARIAERGIPTIRGNHDRWAISGASDLDASALRFLRSLPTHWQTTRLGVRVALHHGSPSSDMAGLDGATLDARNAHALLESARCDVLVVGHTHVPFVVDVAGAGLIANPGAVLRDLGVADSDGPPTPGTFGVLELPGRTFSVRDVRTGEEVACTRRSL